MAVPVQWQTIGLLIFGSVAAALLFLALAPYARVETVAGTIVPDKGVSAIVPARAGIIAALPVREGQEVSAGAELAVIRAEEDSIGGRPAAARIADAIQAQDASLAAQIDASKSAADAQVRQLAAQRAGLAAEIAQLRSQIALQGDLIRSAQADFDRARTIAERGFISLRDLQVREEAVLARRQGLAQLNQTLATREAGLTEAERTAAQVAAQSRAQIASLVASRAEVAQAAASTAGSRAFVLRAPVAGRVAALTARLGQAASPQAPLMNLVPGGSVLLAELAVPSAAIGFVKPGQEVRLAVDAFPYQRFGTIRGRVRSVAMAAVRAQGPNGASVPVYPVTVALDTASISAFGRQEPLIAGMTLTARIVTERQTLLQWLFEPLFAVQQR